MNRLSDELHSDINLKYQGTYVLHNGNVVKFEGVYSPTTGMIYTGADDLEEVGLDSLYCPELPWGAVNNLSGTNALVFYRTAQRTVRKGICENNTYCSQRLNLNRLRAYFNPTYSTFTRLSNPDNSGALSRMFYVQEGRVFMTGFGRIGRIRDGGVELAINSRRIPAARYIADHVKQQLEGIVGNVVINRADVVHEEEEPTPMSRYDQMRQRVREAGVNTIRDNLYFHTTNTNTANITTDWVD